MALYSTSSTKFRAEVGSVIFIMFCEVFYLLVWATIGYGFGGDAASEFRTDPYTLPASRRFLVLWIAYFKGLILPRTVSAIAACSMRSAHNAEPLSGLLPVTRHLLQPSSSIPCPKSVADVDNDPCPPAGHFLCCRSLPLCARAQLRSGFSSSPENEGQLAAFGFVQHNFVSCLMQQSGYCFGVAQRDLFGS